MNVKIPKGDWDDPAPCWIAVAKQDGSPAKPVIKCKCGALCGIAAHHVYADGAIPASFFHAHTSTGLKYASDDGCGWHVFLKLLDYHGGEFPPEPGL